MSIPIWVFQATWILAYFIAVAVSIPNTWDALKSLSSAYAGESGDGTNPDQVSVEWATLFVGIVVTLGVLSLVMLVTGVFAVLNTAFGWGLGWVTILLLTSGAPMIMALIVQIRRRRAYIFRLMEKAGGEDGN